MTQKTEFEWEVNIGDSDILRIKASSLAKLEKKIDAGGEFESWMINSVIKLGANEIYLKSYLPRFIKRWAEEKPPLVCPLCGKPSKDGREHKKCMDREAMMADIGI